MRTENICKFNPYRSSDLICHNFIYEARDTLRTPIVAKEHIMYLVVSGCGSFSADGREYAISEGTLFFTFRGERVSVCSEDKLTYCYISFEGRRADECMKHCAVNSDNRIFYNNQRLVSFWTECIDIAESGNIDMISEAVLLFSFANIPIERMESDDIVTRMISVTHDGFTDPSMSLSTVAEMLGYDPKYMSSVFKKRKGIPYTQFLRELRIKHAIFLMEEGVISVKNVALLSGFEDALYFSKVFAKSEGISPKAYIAKLGSSECDG